MNSRRWIHTLITPRARRPIRKMFPPFRPALEHLEDRAVPTTFTVNSALDLVNPIFGVFTLREAILAANNTPGADTINFDSSLAGTIITLNGPELPQITDDLTITGLGVGQLTIYGNDSSRIFDFGLGTTDTISGLFITHGNADRGGAILNGGTLTVRDCYLSSNSANNNGGGIFNEAGSLTLMGSTLFGNSANADGGGIYNEASLTVTSSLFFGNRAAVTYQFGLGGGIYNEGGTALVQDSTLSANSATTGFPSEGAGGGIANLDGTLTVIGSTLSGNNAFQGAGIFNSQEFGATMTVRDSTLSGNRAFAGGGSGGGIEDLDGTATIAGCTFTGNTATEGGAIFFEDVAGSALLTVSACTITDNSADYAGGGINDSEGAMAVTSSTIARNTAIANGEPGSEALAGGICNAGTMTVTDSKIDNNAVSGGVNFSEGGGIFNNGTMFVDTSAISNNSAAEGGGVFNFRGSTSMSDSFVQQNSAGIGGGIYNFTDSPGEVGTVSANGVTIKANTATTGSGGGIFNDSGVVTLSGGTLDSNVSVTADGGGVFNRAALNLNGTSVTSNSAENGGGIENLGSLTDTGGCLYSHNSAIGGAGLFNDGVATIAGGDFETNSAAFTGGAVDNTGTLTVTASTFNGNTAQSGGGINNGRALAVDASTFMDNTASFGDGGAIANIGSGTLNLTNSALSGNTATDLGGAVDNESTASVAGTSLTGNSAPGGGAIMNDGGALTVDNCLVSGNTAQAGGGILSDGITSGTPSPARLSITRSQISGNTAVNRGGGVANNLYPLAPNENGLATLAVSNCTVSANAAGESGGGIFSGGGTVTIDTSTISANTTNKSGRGGGGISNDFGGILSIGRSTLSGNSADDLGGAIFNEYGTVTLSDSTVSGNSARLGGGIFNSSLGSPYFTNTLSLDNCTVSGNAASQLGGGVFNRDLLRVTNSSIALNRANADGDISGPAGGGIWTSVAIGGRDSTTLNNTIVVGDVRGAPDADQPDDLSGMPVESASAFNVIGDAGTSGGLVGGVNGNIVGVALSQVIDPVLKDNGGPTFTHALVPDSPALNAGSNSLAVDDLGNPLLTDQRGQPRVFAGTVDIGAFELQNARPMVADFTKVGAEDNPQHFTAADFTAQFSDSDGDSLVKVRIVSLPTNGMLKLGGVPVTAGQVIAAADLGNLVFVPALNFNGLTSFTYTASDGIAGFALTPATVTLHIRSAFEQAADLKAMVDALVAAGILSDGQGISLERKLDLNGVLPHDAALVGGFINLVNAYVKAGILMQSQAGPLLDAANTLLISITTT
jgi:hypothetical protein